MSSILDWIFGGGGKTFPAEPLKSYPSVDDARMAEAAGIGYGGINDAYLTGSAGQAYGKRTILPGIDAFIPSRPEGTLSDVFTSPSANIGGRGTDKSRQLQDAFLRAQIASNYVPVGALGLDMRNVTGEVSGRKTNIAGAYRPGTDNIYFNANPDDPSAVLHEAIHRGLTMLKDNPALPEAIRNRINSPMSQEYMVRQFMEQYAGDPEQGEIDKKQKAMAKISPLSKDDIDTLNSLSAAIVAARHPRGPR